MTPQNPFPAVLGLTLAESRILMCVLASAPEPIALTAIHGTIYGDDKLAPCPRVIEKHAKRIREKLALYRLTLRHKRAQGYFLNEEDGRALYSWIERKRRPSRSLLDPIPVALIIAYFGERDRSAHAITKMLDGEVSLDAVRSVLGRARKAGRDIPTFYGGRANRPAMQAGGAF